MQKIILLLSFVMISITSVDVPFVFGQNGDDLIYMTEDYPPWNFEENGKIKGISPDLLRLMWAKMGVSEQPIKLLPWARGYMLVQKEKNHVLMCMTRTKEREPLFKWVGPISTAQYALIGLSKRKIKINSLEDAKKYKIGTIREDATGQVLKTLGFSEKEISLTNRIESTIRMLQLNRIDLIAFDERSFVRLLRTENHDPKEFESVFLLTEEKDYYAFHKDTPDSLIHRFQEALNSLEKEHKKILDHYLK